MLTIVKKGLNFLGIDGAVAFTIFSRILQAISGVISLIFIAKYLTKEEQGYYYTFGSILAIQIFFELGLSNIITQFVAHENAFLIWKDKTSLTGSEESSSRLASLLRFTVKWFLVVSLLLFLGLLVTGYFFFGKFGENDISIEWKTPWIILCITTSLSLMVSPILAFFEGLGMVKEVAKIRFSQQIIQLIFVLGLFILGFKLYSSPIAALLAFVIVPIWILFSSKIKLLRFVWNKLGKWEVNYRKEIFPFQSKIALSWISGYFIFQLFNPVLFATEGAAVSGQMGMTLTVLNAVFSLAFSWIITKIPVFSNLIAQKKFIELDDLFNKTLKQSAILNAIGLLTFLGIIFTLQYFEIKMDGEKISDHFLSFLPLVFMMIPIFLNHFIGAWATYMRCHKKEPMLVQSIVMGLLCSISTITLGDFFGVKGITLGYLLLTFISFNWTYLIFINKKKEWQDG